MKKVLFSMLAFCLMATNSWAIDPTIADLFTAADISTLATKVGAILVSLIGVSLLFMGFRYVRKSLQ